MTPYERHVQQWNKCASCLLYRCRRHVVLARGSLPCEVLLVGEAPGESEDVLGVPFVGPAGKLLDGILQQGLRGRSYCLTNLVACIPRDNGRKGAKAGEPPEYAVRTCEPRLRQLLRLAKPRLVVTVGALAQRYLPVCPGVKAHITHPAAILRMESAQRGLAVQRSVIVLQDAVSDVFE